MIKSKKTSTFKVDSSTTKISQWINSNQDKKSGWKTESRYKLSSSWLVLGHSGPTAVFTWRWWCFWSSGGVSPCWGTAWSPPGWAARLHSSCPPCAPRCWCWWLASESLWVLGSDLRDSSCLKTGEGPRGKKHIRSSVRVSTKASWLPALCWRQHCSQWSGQWKSAWKQISWRDNCS